MYIRNAIADIGKYKHCANISVMELKKNQKWNMELLICRHI